MVDERPYQKIHHLQLATWEQTFIYFVQLNATTEWTVTNSTSWNENSKKQNSYSLTIQKAISMMKVL